MHIQIQENSYSMCVAFFVYGTLKSALSMNEFMNGTEFLHAGRDAIVFDLMVN